MSQVGSVSPRLVAAIERSRRRVWAICYRMTGNRSDADDLAQEAIARAIERAEQCVSEEPTGWLLRLTTCLCIDHLRRVRVQRRLTELVDPIDESDCTVEQGCPSAENAMILEQDLRFAIVAALQHLSHRQRAALILRDVCGQSLAEVAEALGSNENAVKATLQRARVALVAARGHSDVDLPTDASVVESFAEAIQAGSVERIVALLGDDVWGVVDGGGVVVTARKPTFGRRTVAKQWANAKKKLGVPVLAAVRRLNGEAAIVVRLEHAPQVIVAIVHLETRAGLVVAQRVVRDPKRIARLGVPW